MVYYLVVNSSRELIATETVKPKDGNYPFDFDIIEYERIDDLILKSIDNEGTIIPPLSEAEKLKRFLSGVDAAINKKVVDAGILSNQLFYTSKVADNALLILQWHLDNEPEIDPSLMDTWDAYVGGDNEAIDFSDPFIAKYITPIAEAAAYRKTTKPEITPVEMIEMWERMWIYQMRFGFALLGYQRRLQIEQAKMNV